MEVEKLKLQSELVESKVKNLELSIQQRFISKTDFLSLLNDIKNDALQDKQENDNNLQIIQQQQEFITETITPQLSQIKKKN